MYPTGLKKLEFVALVLLFYFTSILFSFTNVIYKFQRRTGRKGYALFKKT